jgi:hypothetical protein
MRTPCPWASPIKYIQGVRPSGILLSLLIFSAAFAWGDTSALWGSSGERWTPAGRLPDFSHAGYREGKTRIPSYWSGVNVKSYGAKGDGRTDDSQAFLDAIAAVKKGAVVIPAGRYVLTKVLKIEKSRLVLRGAGRERTVLFFPKSLTEVVGEGKTHAPGKSWSWSGGFISFEGWDEGEKITPVTAPARRGDFALTVASTQALHRGQWVRLLQWNKGGSLGRHLHADLEDAAADLTDKKLVDFLSRVKAVRGDTVVLERPLRTDVRLAWTPALYAHEPSVQDVGVEDLTIEFPDAPYVGHHEEPGYNAIEFSGITNGWVRRVRIVNADSAIFFRTETKFCTARDVELSFSSRRLRIGYGSDPGESKTAQVGGHQGLTASVLAQDNLFEDFRVDGRFLHDLTLSQMAAGNVFARGQGIDLSFDHHRTAPYENLFTDLQAGEGSRLWESGGDQADGPHSGARETFWNIRTRRPQKLPSWAVQINVVGISTLQASLRSDDANWLEAIPPERLRPHNLYQAQHKLR